MLSVEELSFIERSRNVLDFATAGRLLLKARGSPSTAAMLAQQTGASSRVVNACKAAVGAHVLTSDLGDDFGVLSSGFVASLSTAGAFDAVRTGGAVRLPIENPNFRAVSQIMVGASPGEGQWRPVSSLAVVPGALETAWASTILIATAELLDNAAGAVTLFSNELRRAAIAAVDRAFLPAMATGAPLIPATASVLDDIASAADSMALDSSAKLFLIAPTVNVRHLALATDGDGRRLHPELNVNGGRIAGVQIIPSDYLSQAGSPLGTAAVLLDASQIATADGQLEMDVSAHASVQMSDDPAAGAQPLVSLFQTDSRGLRVRRRVGFAKLRATAAAVIEPVAW